MLVKFWVATFTFMSSVHCENIDIQQRMLEIMLKSPKRLDPLLRQVMVSALQRSQDERDKNNLTPVEYKQDPLLRFMLNFIIVFWSSILFYRLLRPKDTQDADISNLRPPSARQNPLLRQLTSRMVEDFLENLTPPTSRQNPLLRQLASSAVDVDIRNQSPPEYKQNPLLRLAKMTWPYERMSINKWLDTFRQLAPGSGNDIIHGLTAPLKQDPETGNMSLETLMNALQLANEMMNLNNDDDIQVNTMISFSNILAMTFHFIQFNRLLMIQYQL